MTRWFLVMLCLLVASPVLADSLWIPKDVTDHLRGKVGIGTSVFGILHDRQDNRATQLNVQCINDSTVVAIESESLILFGDTAIVEWRVDEDPIQRATWQTCQSSYPCLSLWRGAGISFVKALFDKSDLRTVIHRRYGGDVTADFIIDGAQQAVEPVGKACHWM